MTTQWRPPDPNDPLSHCRCGYAIYHDQTFLNNDDQLIGRVVTYRCAGVVVVFRDGRTQRKTACFHPMNPDDCVTQAEVSR
jgi:hypothetical protein